MSNNSPASVSESTGDEAFFGYEWVDDDIFIEPDHDTRLELSINTSIEHDGNPRTGQYNDSKFSEWSTEQQALGLIWNTIDRTVLMPSEKVQKRLDRGSVLLAAERVSKKQLQKLLGSLRHLTTCLRSAKPFFQQLLVLCNRLRSFQSMRLSEASRRDLR